MPLQSDVRHDRSFGRIVQKQCSKLERAEQQNRSSNDAWEVSFIGLKILWFFRSKKRHNNPLTRENAIMSCNCPAGLNQTFVNIVIPQHDGLLMPNKIARHGWKSKDYNCFGFLGLRGPTIGKFSSKRFPEQNKCITDTTLKYVGP